MSAPTPLVMQATAVAIDGRALLIEGPPGSGKSSLALALVDRGAKLIGDDAVTLTPSAGRLIATPPPNIAGLLEVRGVGLVRMDEGRSTPVALILTLGGPPPDRLPATPLPARVIAGVPVPVLAFEPGSLAPAPRAEWALRLHGIPLRTSSLRPSETPHRSA